MPYKIVKTTHKTRPYSVINTETGKLKGRSQTQKQAQSYVKALYSNEPKGRKKNSVR